MRAPLDAGPASDDTHTVNGADPPPIVIIVAGHTETARIDGISAAGVDPDAMAHTPGADVEILTYGQPIRTSVVPVSPSGCPTPAIVTRAVRDVLDFETIAVDAGLARRTAAPTVSLPADPGRDIRRPLAVPGVRDTYRAARRYGRALPDTDIIVGETIPGGTTTALGVLTALGERPTVSSSLPENPVALKREVVEVGLDASGLTPGETAGNPVATLEHMGDPVLATLSGLVEGATAAGTSVTLAGGTQLAAAAALARHAGVDGPLPLATTPFVVADETAGIRALAADLDLALTVTDPGFDRGDHPAMAAYSAGEAKEGVGMGGALALANEAGISMATVRARIATLTDRLRPDHQPVDQ